MVKKVLNYDGNPVKDGEVLVPVMCDNFMKKYVCQNPDSIRTWTKGGKKFLVMMVAVAKEYEEEAWKSFNQVQNEALGHYGPADSQSMDAAKDDYDLDLVIVPSAEEVYLDIEGLNEAQRRLVKIIEALLKISPKHACAFILMALGYKGAAFAKKMMLGHDAANKVRKQILELAPDGCTSLSQIDVSRLKVNKSKNDPYYVKLTAELLTALMEKYFDL